MVLPLYPRFDDCSRPPKIGGVNALSIKNAAPVSIHCLIAYRTGILKIRLALNQIKMTAVNKGNAFPVTDNIVGNPVNEPKQAVCQAAVIPGTSRSNSLNRGSRKEFGILTLIAHNGLMRGPVEFQK
ncbi:MAG: hypothetical protein LBI85_08320 [Spirochaetaceae bacterium]|jgi:hypothetical protein|nr:hypothetical protein [Spirochaetaceae bacterium]